jgi:DNA-binding NarL/FixJ family response regulator
MRSHSIIVIEDQTVLRETLVHMLDCIEIFHVVGHFADVESALTFLTRHDVNVALIDYEVPDMDGVSFLSKALALRPGLRGLFLSMHTTAAIIRRAFEAGAAGYLPKTVKTEELMDALLVVARGEPYISPALSR